MDSVTSTLWLIDIFMLCLSYLLKMHGNWRYICMQWVSIPQYSILYQGITHTHTEKRVKFLFVCTETLSVQTGQADISTVFSLGVKFISVSQRVFNHMGWCLKCLDSAFHTAVTCNLSICHLSYGAWGLLVQVHDRYTIHQYIGSTVYTWHFR